MEELKKTGGLHLDEDLRTQHAEWRASLVTWIALILVMSATALGLFGGGPVSDARAGHVGGPLWIEYARFARFGASTPLVVHARADASGITRFTLGRPLVDATRITHITPAPVTTRIVADGIEYRFEAEPAGAGAAVIFELQPVRRWIIRAAVSSPGQAVYFWQFIYP